MNKDLTFKEFCNVQNNVEDYLKGMQIKKFNLQYVGGLDNMEEPIKIIKVAYFKENGNNHEQGDVAVALAIKPFNKWYTPVQWCIVDKEEVEEHKAKVKGNATNTETPKEHLNNKEEKQEKTIAEAMSNIIYSISTSIITDCIIENKKDIEQLKKDVKALRKENAKLRQIVNELRKA